MSRSHCSASRRRTRWRRCRRSGGGCSQPETRCRRRSGIRPSPILHKISEHDATFGDVHGWLEATGTEPTGIIGLHVWAEPATRSPLQEEMHARLVGHLEELLAAGEIDPDRLATGDEDARREYVTLQERWMTSPLPDGRVPMTVLLDEQDEAFLADWAAADAEARAALHSMLAAAGERPLPAGGPARRRRQAPRRHRPAGLAGPDARLVQRPQRGLAALRRRGSVADAGHVGGGAAGRPAVRRGQGVRPGHGVGRGGGPRIRRRPRRRERVDDEPDELSAAIAAVCALDHFDWLAVMSALVTGGPGTPASAADLARYVRDFDPEQVIGLAVVDNDFSFAPAVAAVEDDDADADDYIDVEVEAGSTLTTMTTSTRRPCCSRTPTSERATSTRTRMRTRTSTS